MKLIETEPFRKSFRKLPKSIQKKVPRRFAFLYKNFLHPSLHIEKLEPRQKNIWSFRIDKQYRVIFTWGPDTLVLLDIGPHDIYRKH